MKSTTVTKDMLIWNNGRSGMYKSPQGYVLVEYSTGVCRWMSTRQAKQFMKPISTESKGGD